MGDNLKKNMIGAFIWSSVNIGGIQIIQLIIGIILARILLPEEFGLIGVLFVFIGISTVLIDGGLGLGLIRKKEVTDKDFSTIFYLNLFISILLYIILYFTAPLIAIFFGQQELTTLSRVLFLCVLIYPFYQIQLVQLLRNLDYKTNTTINIVSVGLSGLIAILFAFYGLGVWALVCQQLSFHLIKAIMYFFITKWKPVIYFSLSTIRELWRFSVPILGQSFLNVIYNQIYTIIIGRFYPLKQVGYFTQANKYSDALNAASQNIIGSATFPILAKIHDEKERVLRVYRRLTHSISLISFPVAIFLIAAAEPLIITLISEKWLASVRLLQLLLAANLFSPIFTININILNAVGKSKNTLRFELIKKLLITISIIGSFSFGINVMLTGYIIANYIAYLISMYQIKKNLAHYYKHQLLDIIKTLVLSVIVGIITYLINWLTYSHYLKLISMFILFWTLYFLGIRIFFSSLFFEITEKIKQKFSS